VLTVLALSCAAVGLATERSRTRPPLTTKVLRFVTQLCKSARPQSPIPLVCPPLVPVTKYRPFPGLSGVLLGNTNIPPVQPSDQIYLLAFNGGDSGPMYWHWIGSPCRAPQPRRRSCQPQSAYQ
jgi:hypothetical protein